jgi:predicted transcriptional regulator
MERGRPQQQNEKRGLIMSTKEIAIRSIQELPEDATWEDIQERINFVAGVRKGLRELDDGRGIPHERIREEFREWLSS